MADKHDFCRLVLAGYMKDVRRVVPAEDIKKSWGYKYDWGDNVEFHGPDDFYWHGSGCCVYQARSQGWDAFLQQFGYDDILTKNDDGRYELDRHGAKVFKAKIAQERPLRLAERLQNDRKYRGYGIHAPEYDQLVETLKKEYLAMRCGHDQEKVEKKLDHMLADLKKIVTLKSEAEYEAIMENADPEPEER